MKKITDAGLLNIVGKVLDGEFNDFGYFKFKKLRIGVHKIYDHNEYHRDYSRIHAKAMNEAKRKAYAMLKKGGKCPRCGVNNPTDLILCSGCRKIKSKDDEIYKLKLNVKN